ncbi:MAG: hypothetical protein PVJ27_03780, partial [Candidatus Brocadiaceae bacterium]
MPEESMTPLERWLAVLEGEKPDRMPTDYWATAEATEKLLAHLGCSSREEALRRLHVDAPVTVGPRYVGPPIPQGEDVHGCRYRRVAYEGGAYDECVYHPLAECTSVAEVEANYTWPSPDLYDYSVIPGQIEGHQDRPVRGGGS